MSGLISQALNGYYYVSVELSDPRTRNSWFINSPVYVPLLAIVYYKFVKQWGPAFMKNRQPYNIKTILIWYNLVQVFTSIYLSYNVFKIYATGYYKLSCQSVATIETSEEKDILRYFWIYAVLKYVDLLDTVFFVLRKNYRQVTFLHIYHHIGMLFMVSIGNKYIPGGHGIIVSGVNSFIHAFMYSYYLLSVVNEEYNKSIWWKKHITQLQIIQFFILIVHFGHVLFRPDCGYPKWISFILIPNLTLILYLFCKFYYDTYILKKPKNERNHEN